MGWKDTNRDLVGRNPEGNPRKSSAKTRAKKENQQKAMEKGKGKRSST